MTSGGSPFFYNNNIASDYYIRDICAYHLNRHNIVHLAVAFSPLQFYIVGTHRLNDYLSKICTCLRQISLTVTVCDKMNLY